MLTKSFLGKYYNDREQCSSFDLESYQPLSVTYQLRGSILRRIRMGQPLLSQIDGRDETKADVIRSLLSGAYPYLISEEGTGKTRLAKSLTGLLPPVPFIRGCPYHDDPKWPRELLCPRCGASNDPVKEFGIDLVSGISRFSRVQGNEYTNEAKLLGLKDIQAIANGKSPSDPQVFIGTGVFRANRGILFVDELPSIRTKVQVLLHPILEERKAIMEEYSWEHPLDLVIIATGNPRGFAHVNDIPRPLLDRLETIYMDLPEEDVEREIMLKETFSVCPDKDHSDGVEEPQYSTLEEIIRDVAAPWWIIDIINKAVRHSRICPYIEKRASIRATNRALDHTYASVEMENMLVANLRHAYYGLRLALRGRLELRADIIDFDNPKKTFKLGDTLVADFIWNVFEDMRSEAGLLSGCDRQKLGLELDLLISSQELDPASSRLPWAIASRYDELMKALQWMRRVASNKANKAIVGEPERGLYDNHDATSVEECNYSALEILVNICVHERTLDESKAGRFFIPGKFSG